MSVPRPLRIEYPGAIYQVMSRGDRREPIFNYDQDRQRSLATMDEAAAKTEWQIYAVCLMPNHVHIEKRMEVRRAADLDGEWRGIRRGWCLGDEEFREELLAAVHCLNKKPAIGITTKELSSEIAAIRDVINRSRVLNPQLARHVGNLCVRGNIIKN